MHDGAFVGDGSFPGDGGADLQHLWEFANWKMIPNCPGRYVIRTRRDEPWTINGTAPTDLDAQGLILAAFGQERAQHFKSYPLLSSDKCTDSVQVVLFPHNLGGLLSYCKRKQDDSIVYVHTLNTTSGLHRKLHGLGLENILP